MPLERSMRRANRETLHGDNMFVVGDDNTVFGDRCRVHGNRNLVIGNDNEVVGSHNAARGVRNHVRVSTSAVLDEQGGRNDDDSPSPPPPPPLPFGFGQQPLRPRRTQPPGEGDLGFHHLGNGSSIGGLSTYFAHGAAGTPSRSPHNGATASASASTSAGYAESVASLRGIVDVAEDDAARACVVCMERARSVLVEPCSHLCLCAQCAVSEYGGRSAVDALSSSSSSAPLTCPMCRERIERLRRVFV